ncbi:patatin-like protein 2 [Momordica charantia]|uniref:Patatin-like protein 2 n=1 Tax=Momordica charantia TaxID=3673 RepID=A0A6J1DZQ3_MOMCH|nr:patatin-like protein 2 [Momordica charantia]
MLFCLTSASRPPQLPSHRFQTHHQGKTEEFDLVDTGTCANSLAVLGTFERLKGFRSVVHRRKFLMISLGSGFPKQQHGLRIPCSSTQDIEDMFCHPSQNGDVNLGILFRGTESEAYYLRIHEEVPSEILASASVDMATTKNLKRLVKFGEQLLDKPVSKEGIFYMKDAVHKGYPSETNRQALVRFAKLLSHNKRSSSTNNTTT